MHTLWLLVQQDLKTSFRDPIFRFILLFPFLALALVYYALPYATKLYPVIVPYQEVILMWACMQTSVMFGFIYGFLFLEEKEEHVFQVLCILPISTMRLIGSRLLVGIVSATFINYLMISIGSIMDIAHWKALLIAFQFSLLAPLIALLLGIFAKNKIEGMAQMKIFNLLWIIPALIYFLSSPYLHIMAIIPSYWSFRSIETSTQMPSFLLFLGIGFAYYSGLLYTLNSYFQRNIKE